MTKFFRAAALLMLCMGVQACASITTGTTQSVAVDTTPVQQATCTMQNEKGQWTVVRTPGIATVSKAYGPLSVQCRTEAGHAGSSSVNSTTAGAAFGNIIAGGIVGAAVDMGSGAAYQYPAQILVSLSSPAGSPAPVAGAMTPAASPTSPQALVICRLRKVEEYRDETWCKEAGGKVIHVGPPQQPGPSTIASVATPPAPSVPMAAAAPQIVGTCYLPDGSKEPLPKDACMAKKGFIGA